MADLFTVLEADHLEVKNMLAELSAGASTDPKSLAQRLVIEESKHEAVEEMYFWPVVRERVEGGDALADEGTAQEQEGKEVLDRLDHASPGQTEFEQMVSKFVTAGREHIAFEEDRVWPRLRSVLSIGEQEELGRKYLEGKKSAPTRPHPNTPPEPGLLKTAGPVAAAVDKVRDAVSDRG